MKFGIVMLPGSNCDHDAEHVLRNVVGVDVEILWHKDRTLKGSDCVIIPGGFSYGDYLRAGALARFSPVMEEVRGHANAGGLVVGICNGFQILTEARLLPGSLLRNDGLRFVCRDVLLRVETTSSAMTQILTKGEILRLPIAHGQGNYMADTRTLDELDREGQVLFRYCHEVGSATAAANPNGSQRGIAGICNRERNVFGMMPHPERASEEILGGGRDGVRLFHSLVSHFAGDVARTAV